MTEQSWVRRVVERELKSHLHATSRESIHCEELRDSASDYIDGDISKSLGSRIRVHLGLCDGCQGWLSGLWSTVRLLRALPKAEPPESLMANIRRLK